MLSLGKLLLPNIEGKTRLGTPVCNIRKICTLNYVADESIIANTFGMSVKVLTTCTLCTVSCHCGTCVVLVVGHLVCEYR